MCPLLYQIFVFHIGNDESDIKPLIVSTNMDNETMIRLGLAVILNGWLAAPNSLGIGKTSGSSGRR